jgi:hypothetical protein
VTFERAAGRPVNVHADATELMALAAELERHGRRALGERVRAMTLGDPPGTTIVVADQDIPALTAAVDNISAALALTDGWAGVRNL